MKSLSHIFLLFILSISAAYSAISYAAELKDTNSLSNATNIIANNHDVFYLTNKTKSRDLKKLPETTPVVLPKGTVLSAADLNRLSRYGEAMQKSKKKALPKGLTQKPKKRGTLVNSSEDLEKALKRKDRDTLVLPTGERLTVGMLKLLEPQVENKLGRSLTETGGRSKTIKVDKKTDWKNVLQMPDNTILQAPNGTKITLIQLKETLAKKVKGNNSNLLLKEKK